MKIVPTKAVPTENTLGALSAGDWFVRNANKSRPLETRCVYMLMHQHTRFEHLRKYSSTREGPIVVNLHNGRISALSPNLPVLKLQDRNVMIPVEE